MATRWYRTGQISATNGSRTVTGTSTLWVNGNSLKPEAGDIFTVDFSKFYEVESITSDTELLLFSAWDEADVADSAYAIVRNASVNINTRVANMVTQALSQKQLMLDEFNVWLTEETLDTVPIHDAFGNVLTFKPLPKLIKDIEDLIGSVPDLMQYVTLSRRWANENENVEVDPTNFPGQYSARHWSIKSQGFGTVARNWANADSGVQPDPTNFPNQYSARHWSIQSSGYTDLNRRWANEAKNTVVDPTNFPSQYSGLHYSSVASDFSTKASQWSDNAKDAEVESGRYSARHWSEISQDWAATAIGTIVDSGLYSSLHYSDLSRKWSNTAHGTQVDPTGFPNQYSGRHWSTESQNFATTSQTHRNKAEEWAQNPENDPVETGQFSALHWSAKASAFATTAEGHKNNAELARNAARGFRDEAEGFRDEAEGFRDGASAQAEQARKWATNDYNVPPDSTNFPGQFSARHWALYAQYFASQTIVSGGLWTPTSGTEYPTPADVNVDTIFIVKFATASDSYTFTAGDLSGTTVFNSDYLFWDSDTTTWQHIPTPSSAAILQINGKTGTTVTLVSDDIPHAGSNVGAVLTRIAPLADGSLQRAGGTARNLVIGAGPSNGGRLEFVPDPAVTGANNVVAEIVGREMRFYSTSPADVNVRFQNQGSGSFHLDVEGRATFNEVVDVVALGPGSHATFCLHDSGNNCSAIMYTPTGVRDLHLETRATDGTTVGGSFVLRNAGNHEMNGTLTMLANASEGGHIELQADPQNPNTGNFVFDVSESSARIRSNGTDNTTLSVSNDGTGSMAIDVAGYGYFDDRLYIDSDTNRTLYLRNASGEDRAQFYSDSSTGDAVISVIDGGGTRHTLVLDHGGAHTLTGDFALSTGGANGGTGALSAVTGSFTGSTASTIQLTRVNDTSFNGISLGTTGVNTSQYVLTQADDADGDLILQSQLNDGTANNVWTHDRIGNVFQFNTAVQDSNGLGITGDVDYYYRNTDSTITISARRSQTTSIHFDDGAHSVTLAAAGFAVGDKIVIRNLNDTNGLTTITNSSGVIVLPDKTTDAVVTLLERGTVELTKTSANNFSVSELHL